MADKKKHKKRESWVAPDIWDAWVEAWGQSNIVQQSTQAKHNRRGGGEGPALPTHTGGSISYRTLLDRLRTQFGRDLSLFEVFVYTHTRNHDGVTFVDVRSREIHDGYQRLLEVQTQSQSDEQDTPVDTVQLYVQAAGGIDRKQRLYGSGSLRPTIQATQRQPGTSCGVGGSSTQGSTSHDCPAVQRVQELEAEVLTTQQRMHALEEEMRTMIRRVDSAFNVSVPSYMETPDSDPTQSPDHIG